MDISSALKRTWREDITLRSIIANTISSYYFEKAQKKIEIESIQIRGKKILVKTGSSIMNTELIYLSGDILSLLQKKISPLKLPFPKEAELRFIV